MKQFLLDTHALIWFIEGEGKLSKKSKDIIKNIDHEIIVSVVNLWEMAIKISLGKLKLSKSLEGYIRCIEEEQFSYLNIEYPHILQVEQMPFHHKDPFDRMLIAQGITEDLPIISKDGRFDAYPVERVW